MNDSLCFVQFLHPGGEHGPDNGRWKGWTIGPHRRKFLLSEGCCLIDGKSHVAKLVFWGEWEAQSEVVGIITDPVHDGPHWIHRPYFVPPESYRHMQNTDPFVFGGPFQYTGCLQHTKFGPTQMRNLARGSVILFGSSIRRSEFVVDTVFVVDRHIDHSKRDYQRSLEGQISETYDAVTISPWYANTVERDKVHRLYYGATFDAPVDGMFSFFPCLPSNMASRGFARPEVFIPGSITPTQTQNKKLTHAATTGDIKGLWSEVVRQITAQGLLLGINAVLPPRRRPNSL